MLRNLLGVIREGEIYSARGALMKYLQTLTILSVCGFFLAVAPAKRIFAAQQQPNQQAGQQQQQAPPQQAQTFTGTMVQKSGQYLFVDDSTKTTRKLDHQSDLSKYQLNGKKVEILGTLDASNNTIHILKIALIRSKA
jgi:hypothetical protein